MIGEATNIKVEYWSKGQHGSISKPLLVYFTTYIFIFILHQQCKSPWFFRALFSEKPKCAKCWSIPLSGSTPYVKAVYFGLRPILHLSFMEVRSVFFFCNAADRPTSNKQTWVKFNLLGESYYCKLILCTVTKTFRFFFKCGRDCSSGQYIHMLRAQLVGVACWCRIQLSRHVNNWMVYSIKVVTHAETCFLQPSHLWLPMTLWQSCLSVSKRWLTLTELKLSLTSISPTPCDTTWPP